MEEQWHRNSSVSDMGDYYQNCRVMNLNWKNDGMQPSESNGLISIAKKRSILSYYSSTFFFVLFSSLTLSKSRKQSTIERRENGGKRMRRIKRPKRLSFVSLSSCFLLFSLLDSMITDSNGLSWAGKIFEWLGWNCRKSWIWLRPTGPLWWPFPPRKSGRFTATGKRYQFIHGSSRFKFDWIVKTCHPAAPEIGALKPTVAVKIIYRLKFQWLTICATMWIQSSGRSERSRFGWTGAAT